MYLQIINFYTQKKKKKKPFNTHNTRAKGLVNYVYLS